MSLCYAYGRHSTSKQSQSEQVQLEKCEEYFARELLPKGVQWAGWFYDPAVSACKHPFSERPKGREVFAAAQPGDHVVISKLDRAFRSLLDGKNVSQQFMQRGVFFHALDYKIDTATPQGRFMLSIFLAGAELELEMTRERTMEALNYKRENKLPYTRTPPMGWKFVRSQGQRQYRIDLAERDFCEFLWQSNASGASFNDLAMYSWINAKTIKQKRAFSSPEAVRWAIHARDLGYPIECNYRRVKRMHQEWVMEGRPPQPATT